jgi:ABC-2 type transport system ATP-binding protein
LILAVLHKPKALILDEPTSGLDPFHQRTFFEIIKEFANNGAAILLSSHIISEVEKVADSMAVLRDGAKVYDESYETFSSKAAEQGEDLEDAFFKFYDKREG